MGAAFDRDGNLLGVMQADEAHEIRIKKQIEETEQKYRDVAKQQTESIGRDRMLQFFTYSHLPDHLAKVSLPFCQLAEEICATLPSNPERTVALRKLLEAKDCAVRALLYK